MRVGRCLARLLAGLTRGALVLAVPGVASADAARQLVRLIVDTDIFSDVDDAGALALANAFADTGEARLLAVMVNTPSRWGAPAADAIDTYYRRGGGVPVGTLQPVDDSTFEKDYARVLAKEYPNSTKDGARAPDAVQLYRRVLASQPDHSVTIASVGFLTNRAALLESGPDVASRLSGRDLVARKVHQLVVMGGTYPSGREWNFAGDVAATKKVVEEWPTRQVYSGFEVGATVFTGARLDQTPADNPVRHGYEIYVGAGNDRESWDLTAVYYAVRGGDDLFTESRQSGSVKILHDGSNAWVDSPVRDQTYLVKTASDETIARTLEDLMLRSPVRG